MKPIRAIMLIIFTAALAFIAVCIFTDWNDELFLTIGLVLSAIGNIINILYIYNDSGNRISDFLRRLQGTFKKGILFVKYRDFSCSVQSALHLNRRRSATAARNRYFLSRNFYAVVTKIIDKALTVGNVSGQLPVFIHNRIDCPNQFRCR